MAKHFHVGLIVEAAKLHDFLSLIEAFNVANVEVRTVAVSLPAPAASRKPIKGIRRQGYKSGTKGEAAKVLLKAAQNHPGPEIGYEVLRAAYVKAGYSAKGVNTTILAARKLGWLKPVDGKRGVYQLGDKP
jgi:hypothetical protein